MPSETTWARRARDSRHGEGKSEDDVRNEDDGVHLSECARFFA
jgi:hypothetical protein